MLNDNGVNIIKTSKLYIFVQELLGKSFFDLYVQKLHHKITLSLPTVCIFAAQMLESIKGIYELGYCHCKIKT